MNAIINDILQRHFNEPCGDGRRRVVEHRAWQMATRQKIKLAPDAADPISRLLFHALYSADTEEQFVASVEQHIEDLARTVRVMKGGVK